MAPDPVGCCNNGPRRVQLPRKAVPAASTAPPAAQLTPEQKQIVEAGTAVAEYVICNRNTVREESVQATAKRMVDLVEEIKPQTTVVFNHLCSELTLTTHNARTVFFDVTSELFHDEFNFGRIVSIYAFARHMAQYFDVRGKHEMPQRVISWVTVLLEKKCTDWMLRNGGWDGFQKHFPGPRASWTTATKGILMAAVGLGVAGCLFIKMK